MSVAKGRRRFVIVDRPAALNPDRRPGVKDRSSERPPLSATKWIVGKPSIGSKGRQRPMYRLPVVRDKRDRTHRGGPTWRREVPCPVLAMQQSTLQGLHEIPDSKRLPNKAHDLRCVRGGCNHVPAISAGQNHSCARIEFRGFSNYFLTISARDCHIQKNQVNVADFGAKKFDCRRPIGGFEYVKARLTEHLHDGFAQNIFVFHNQNGCMLRRCQQVAAGHRTTASPPPGLSSWKKYSKGGALA